MLSSSTETHAPRSANLEDMALEVFLAAAGEHNEVVQDYLDQIKESSETRKTVRAIQALIAHLQRMEAQYGPRSMEERTAPAEAQAEWHSTVAEVNGLIASCPYVAKALRAETINNFALEDVKTKLENAASELGDLGQELQQRMSHAVSLASRHYELGSTILKKFHDTSAAIIRNI